MRPSALFLVSFMIELIGTRLVSGNLGGYDGHTPQDDPQDATVLEPAGKNRGREKPGTRFYDLLIEFDKDDDIRNPECVQDVVRGCLSEKVFKFLVENKLTMSNERDEFVKDWNVEVLSFEEVQVKEMPTNTPCDGSDECKEGETLCNGTTCFNPFKKRKKKNRRRWKANITKRRYVVRSRAECTLCYPDNSDPKRKLETENEISNSETDGPPETSLRGTKTETISSPGNATALEASKGDLTNKKKKKKKKRRKNKQPVSHGPPILAYKNETKEILPKVGETKEEDLPIYWVEDTADVLQRFRETTGRELKRAVRKICDESPTRASLIYVEEVQ